MIPYPRPPTPFHGIQKLTPLFLMSKNLLPLRFCSPREVVPCKIISRIQLFTAQTLPIHHQVYTWLCWQKYSNPEGRLTFQNYIGTLANILFPCFLFCRNTTWIIISVSRTRDSALLPRCGTEHLERFPKRNQPRRPTRVDKIKDNYNGIVFLILHICQGSG